MTLITREKTQLGEIQSWDDVPDFETEAEEAEFWDTHTLGERLLDRMEAIPDGVLPPASVRTVPITFRLGQDALRRLQALADRRQRGYQALILDFVLERLHEEEQREGLSG